MAKTNRYSMNELPTLELRLIPEEYEFASRGKKRGAEGDILPPPQKGREGGARGSSVPPGSATAKARAQAEAKKLQEQKGKGSTKGTSKGLGKQDKAKGFGKLPSTFVPTSSVSDDQEVPMEERKKKLMNRDFQEWTWGILRSSLIQQGVTIHNLTVLEFTYLHWYNQLEHIPINVPLQEALNPLFEVELAAFISDFPEDLTQEREDIS